MLSLDPDNNNEKINKILAILNSYNDKLEEENDSISHNCKNSYILEPLHKIIKANKSFNNELRAILSHPEKRYESDILTTNFSIKLEKENELGIEKNNNYSISRQLIGFITSGGLSFAKCKGIGKGFISVEALKLLIKLKQDLNLDKIMVLIREKNSRFYKLCNLKVISLTN